MFLRGEEYNREKEKKKKTTSRVKLSPFSAHNHFERQSKEKSMKKNANEKRK